MHRRRFLTSAAAASVIGAVPLKGAAAAGSRDAALRTMLDRFFYARLDDSPEQATRLGLDTGTRSGLKSRLDDQSAAARARELAQAKAELAELRAFGTGGLSSDAALDHEIVTYQLTRAVAGAKRFTYGSSLGRFAPYVLSQLTGPYRDVPDFLESQTRVRDAGEADAYLQRLSALPKAIDDSSEQQRSDAARGVFAPDYILDTTLKQLGSAMEGAAAQSVMVTSFALSAMRLPVSSPRRVACSGDSSSRA